MDDNEDFFFNAALSCFKSTKLFGYSSLNTQEYEKQLSRALENNLPSDVEFKELQWKCESRVFNQNSIEFSFIYIECREALYRICLLAWDTGCMILANCAPTVLAACTNWIHTRFDSIIKPFAFPSELLRSEYNTYMRKAASESRHIIIDSELIFTTPSSAESSSQDLSKITVAVRGEDISIYYHRNTDDVLEPLYNHLRTHTAIDFSQLKLTRVNCGGFIMTNAGKLKIFKSSMDSAEMWDMIARLLLTAQKGKGKGKGNKGS